MSNAHFSKLLESTRGVYGIILEVHSSIVRDLYNTLEMNFMCNIKKYVHEKNLKKIHSERRIQKYNRSFYFLIKKFIYTFLNCQNLSYLLINKGKY